MKNKQALYWGLVLVGVGLIAPVPGWRGGVLAVVMVLAGITVAAWPYRGMLKKTVKPPTKRAARKIILYTRYGIAAQGLHAEQDCPNLWDDCENSPWPCTRCIAPKCGPHCAHD